MGLTYELNRLAGTLVNGRSTLAEQGAANLWAGIAGDWSTPNRLTANEASAGDTLGDTTGFLPNGIALNYYPAGGEDGTGGIGITSIITTGVMFDLSCATGGGTGGTIPITVGNSYQASMRVRNAGALSSATHNMQLRFYWETAANAPISNSSGSEVPVPDAWTTVTVTATAPATAAFVGIAVRSGSAIAGNAIRFDKFGFWDGVGSEWVMPGSGTGALLSTLGALNVKNGTTNLGLRAVCNALGGTTNEDPAYALSQIP